jgi:pimeloyl-ACP methyl ester carboxylesterase
MELTFDGWHKSGQAFSHQGRSIFYQAAGSVGADSRASLLCIHGFPTASWDWSGLWPMLVSRFEHVLAPDMIGFGWSDKPPEYPYSIFDQADLHEALLRAKGVTRYRVIAHDYGVTVAQELLARDDERRRRGDHSLVLEKVCFLNGGLFPESHRPLLIQRLMLTPLGPLLSRSLDEKKFARSFVKTFGPNTRPSPQAVHEFFQLVLAGDGLRMFYRLFHYMPERRLHRERWVSALREASASLRLVNGAADPISGAHLLERYRELIPSPDTVLLPGIGHYPHVEAPQAVWRAAEPFLSG